jgi:putative membrane protein
MGPSGSLLLSTVEPTHRTFPTTWIGHKMKKLIITVAAATLMASAAARAQDATTTMAPATTATTAAGASSTAAMTADQYVATAASSDMFEIQSSKMALEMTKSEAVKKFAKHMVSDHSMTTKEIMAAAKEEKIAVPTEMLAKHAEMLASLKAADSSSFDALYIKMQEAAHEEAVALHTGYAKSGDDAALKAVAQKAVPIVTEHLKDVQAMQKA